MACTLCLDRTAAGCGLADFAPNGALPTDDSPTLFGILASGARDGSQIAYRGTSFAAAQATRLLAARLAKVGGGFGTTAISDIEAHLRALNAARLHRQNSSQPSFDADAPALAGAFTALAGARAGWTGAVLVRALSGTP